MKTIAIYHKDCTDGTGAAAVVLKKYPEALLYPLGHGFEAHELEPILSQAMPGDQIFTVDCVIGASEFLKAGFAVTSIDHHIGIKDQMDALAKEYSKFTFIFDNTKSGATLSWSYFFPNEKMPDILKYIEDADIWTWKYGNDTRNVGSLIFPLANKPQEILKLFTAPIEPIIRDGGIITNYANNLIDHAVEKTEPIYLKIGQYRVPFYNITVLKSESGNKLSQLRKEAVALFSIDGNKVKISFRSIDGQKPQALELAQELQGNGHKNAAGAGMSLQTFINSIVS